MFNFTINQYTRILLISWIAFFVIFTFLHLFELQIPALISLVIMVSIFLWVKYGIYLEEKQESSDQKDIKY